MKQKRMIGTLVGDVVNDVKAQTKYGHLFYAMEAHFSLTTVYDASLSGSDRWLNAIWAFHINRRRWRNRFYKNVPAFKQRSRRASTALQEMADKADFIFQVGAMFHAQTTLPTIIYTDYTSQLSARKPEAGRSPFRPAEREKWISRERLALREAVHVFTRGSFVRDAIIADYGVPADRVTAVGGGVNFAALPSIETKASGSPTALFIGKSLYRKGGDILLKAFAIAREKVPEARLLMLTDDQVPAELPTGGVEFVDAAWDRAAISNLYREAHCFVLPSRLETWGDVLLEAMAYQLPCIGVDSDAMSEIIDHEKNGLIVPPENVDALADALVRLFVNTEERQTLGVAAREKVERAYTWEHVVARLVPIIHTCLQGHK